MIISAQDLKNGFVSLPLIFVGLIMVSSISFTVSYMEGITFLFSGIICVFFYSLVGKIIKNGLGAGDIAFGFFQGICIFPQFIWLCILTESVAGLLFFLIRKHNRKIKFVPFMSLGLIICQFVQTY